MVGDHCNRDVLTVTPDETIREIAKKLDQRDAGCAVVIDEDSRPCGIVTDRDIAIRVVRRHRDPDETTAREIMSAELVKVRDEAPLETAIRRMRAEGIRRIPVVGSDGRVVGLLTGEAALTYLARDLSAAAQVAHAQRALTASA